jgi:hypothetical protein
LPTASRDLDDKANSRYYYRSSLLRGYFGRVRRTYRPVLLLGAG